MKILIRAGFTLIIALLVIGFLTARTHTPHFVTSAGREIPGSIAEERFISLGGEDQYVLLRGASRKAPILIFLHGGPGTSAMAFNRVFNADLERDFLMVNWDQRGTGYSFNAGADVSTLTLEQITADLDQLIDILRAEFDQEKVIIVGHSWGSTLGLHYASRYPEKLALYVGIGQMADTARSETLVYEWAYAQAKQAQNPEHIAILEEIGAPPYENTAEMMRHRGVVSQYGGAWIDPMSDLRYARTAIKAPEFSWTGLRTILRGADRSLPALSETFTTFNAAKAYPKLNAPIAFFLGRGDQVVSAIPASDYFDKVEAPWKERIWFEQSAHSPHWEEPERYMKELRRIVKIVTSQ